MPGTPDNSNGCKWSERECGGSVKQWEKEIKHDLHILLSLNIGIMVSSLCCCQQSCLQRRKMSYMKAVRMSSRCRWMIIQANIPAMYMYMYISMVQRSDISWSHLHRLTRAQLGLVHNRYRDVTQCRANCTNFWMTDCVVLRHFVSCCKDSYKLFCMWRNTRHFARDFQIKRFILFRGGYRKLRGGVHEEMARACARAICKILLWISLLMHEFHYHYAEAYR